MFLSKGILKLRKKYSLKNQWKGYFQLLNQLILTDLSVEKIFSN